MDLINSNELIDAGYTFTIEDERSERSFDERTGELRGVSFEATAGAQETLPAYELHAVRDWLELDELDLPELCEDELRDIVEETGEALLSRIETEENEATAKYLRRAHEYFLQRGLIAVDLDPEAAAELCDTSELSDDGDRWAHVADAHGEAREAAIALYLSLDAKRREWSERLAFAEQREERYLQLLRAADATDDYDELKALRSETWRRVKRSRELCDAIDDWSNVFLSKRQADRLMLVLNMKLGYRVRFSEAPRAERPAEETPAVVSQGPSVRVARWSAAGKLSPHVEAWGVGAFPGHPLR